MINVAIDSVPNQQFTIRLDNNRYSISIKSTDNVMAVTIVRNDSVIVSGQRAVAGGPIIPYLYQEDGNLIFLTENDDLPDYTKFNSSQSLIYMTIDELVAIRG